MRAGSGAAVAFGRVLRRLREKRGMSRLTLAQDSGIHLDRIAQLEGGADEPDLVEVFAIAAALGMKASELVEQVTEA